MKKYILPMLAMFIATPAGAAIYNISVTGTLTSQGSQYNYNCGCIPTDANLSVGSQLILTASFDASLLIPWGDTGYSIVGLYGLPTTGDSFFRIDAPGMIWQASDSIADSTAFYSHNVLNEPWVKEALPAIIIQGDKVIGLAGDLSVSGSSARPELILGSYAGYGDGQHFTPAALSDGFAIDAPNGMYWDYYNSQGFSGVWDFANSSVVDPPSPNEVSAISAVPEPATWAMFLIGFGMLGLFLRYKGNHEALRS